MTAIIAAAVTKKDKQRMPFTIEFRKADAVLGGVSYITRAECQAVYNSLGHTVDAAAQFRAVLMDEADQDIEEKAVDEFDVKVLLGWDEL